MSIGYYPSATLRQLAIERSGGPKRPDESEEAFEERVASRMPKPDRAMPTTPEAAAAAARRKQREGVKE